MLNEAEIIDRTGIVYLKECLGASSMGLSEPLNLYNPMFSTEGTGEDVSIRVDVQPTFSRRLLPFERLSVTTGSELSDISGSLLVLLVLGVASENVVTDYKTTFELKESVQMKLQTRLSDPAMSPDTHSVSIQAKRLREISGLKVERLAEIFGVSRTTYNNWMSGSSLHDTHREHLLEVLSLVEEAAQRFGSPGALNTWLLTPVSPEGKKPIDYLATREYSIFRGFLLRVRTGRETFRPLAPSARVHQERSQDEFEHTLERLRPKAWRDADEVDTSDINDKEV